MFSLHTGDCREYMARLDAASIDAIVTDPPYELGFMGKGWDRSGIAYDVVVWREALRVLKPGAYVVAFGGSRTYHRLACAIEDAGFEIRDQLQWLYGSGFPKSLDVSKALDKAAGAEREVVGERSKRGAFGGVAYAQDEWTLNQSNQPLSLPISAPATELAQRYEGWGTALKPAHEPIVLARKPLIGTVATNVAQHDTGTLNIDGCRIGYEEGGTLASNPSLRDSINGGNGGHIFPAEDARRVVTPNTAGRWPANVLLDEEAGALLDAQSGERKSGKLEPHHKRYSARLGQNTYGDDSGGELATNGASYGGDTGGASRFFYCAKASRSERNAGLDGMPERESKGDFPALVCNVCGCRHILNYRPTCGHDDFRREVGQPRANHHPTVKPIALMRWLVRLITPPGGLILDPFTGSGSTGCAAVLEGFQFMGCDLDPEYVEIARRRMEHHSCQHRANRPPPRSHADVTCHLSHVLEETPQSDM